MASSAFDFGALAVAAEDVTVVDAGGYFAGAEVEAVLAELAAGTPFDYSTYTATWVATGGGAAIGDSVVVARYLQIGKFVHCYGSITFGSTATFGSGAYRFGFPVNCSTSMSSGDANLAGNLRLYDTSTASWYSTMSPWAASASTFGALYGATYGGTITEVGNASPWAWAVGDVIGWNLVYEAV